MMDRVQHRHGRPNPGTTALRRQLAASQNASAVACDRCGGRRRNILSCLLGLRRAMSSMRACPCGGDLNHLTVQQGLSFLALVWTRLLPPDPHVQQYPA